MLLTTGRGLTRGAAGGMCHGRPTFSGQRNSGQSTADVRLSSVAALRALDVKRPTLDVRPRCPARYRASHVER